MPTMISEPTGLAQERTLPNVRSDESLVEAKLHLCLNGASPASTKQGLQTPRTRFPLLAAGYEPHTFDYTQRCL